MICLNCVSREINEHERYCYNCKIELKNTLRKMIEDRKNEN